jgi:hypothetical protein
MLQAEAEGVILLELRDLFQSLSLDELPHGAAVSQLHEVALEVIISESEVEVLFWVVLHLLQLGIDHLSEIFVDVDVDSRCVRV